MESTVFGEKVRRVRNGKENDSSEETIRDHQINLLPLFREILTLLSGFSLMEFNSL